MSTFHTNLEVFIKEMVVVQIEEVISVRFLVGKKMYEASVIMCDGKVKYPEKGISTKHRLYYIDYSKEQREQHFRILQEKLESYRGQLSDIGVGFDEGLPDYLAPEDVIYSSKV